MSDTEEPLTKPKALKPRSEAQKAATEKMKQARQAKITEKKTVIPEGKTLSKLEQKKLYLQAVKEKLNKTPKRQETEPLSYAEDDDESEVEESEVESEPEPLMSASRTGKPAPKPKPKAKPPVKATAKKSIKNKAPAVHIPSESEESEAEEVIVVKKKSKPKKPKKKTIIIEESSDDDDDEGHTDSEDEPAPVYKAPTRATKSQKHKSSTNRGPSAPVVERPQYQCYFG